MKVTAKEVREAAVSKMHFEALAAALRSSFTQAKLSPQQAHAVAAAVAQSLARFNPLFDASRFMAAAGA
jgi:hypothetical protein